MFRGFGYARWFRRALSSEPLVIAVGLALLFLATLAAGLVVGLVFGGVL
jgi:hypothetical protein